MHVFPHQHRGGNLDLFEGLPHLSEWRIYFLTE